MLLMRPCCTSGQASQFENPPVYFLLEKMLVRVSRYAGFGGWNVFAGVLKWRCLSACGFVVGGEFVFACSWEGPKTLALQSHKFFTVQSVEVLFPT
jgi:hypothetical protein